MNIVQFPPDAEPYGLTVDTTEIPTPAGYSWYNLNLTGGELWLSGHKGVGVSTTPAAARLTSLAGSWEVYETGYPSYGSRVYKTYRYGSVVHFSFAPLYPNGSTSFMRTTVGANTAASLGTSPINNGYAKSFSVANDRFIITDFFRLSWTTDGINWTTYNNVSPDYGDRAQVFWDGSYFTFTRSGSSSSLGHESADLVAWTAGVPMSYIREEVSSGDFYGIDVGSGGSTFTHKRVAGVWSPFVSNANSVDGSLNNGYLFRAQTAYTSGGELTIVRVEALLDSADGFGTYFIAVNESNRHVCADSSFIFEDKLVHYEHVDPNVNGTNVFLGSDDGYLIVSDCTINDTPPPIEEFPWDTRVENIQLYDGVARKIFVPNTNVPRQIRIIAEAVGDIYSYADLIVTPELAHASTLWNDYYVDYTDIESPVIVYDVPAGYGDLYIVLIGEGFITAELALNPFWTARTNCVEEGQ